MNPLCMHLFGGQGLPHLGHLNVCKVLYHVLLKACPLSQGTVAVHMETTTAMQNGYKC